MSAHGPDLPLCVWAQVAALVVGEALDPEGVSVPPSEALAWLDAVDRLADPALDDVPGIREARQAIPNPVSARQVLSSAVVAARALPGRLASARPEGDHS